MNNSITIFFLFFFLVNGHSQNEFKAKINASQNDGVEFGDLSFSSFIEILTIGGSSDSTMVGLRFESINIPKEATIDSAFIQFSSLENSDFNETVFINIEMEGESNIFPFGGENILFSRKKSHDWVPWRINAFWIDNARSDLQKTPDLSDLIEQVILLPEWETGNPISLFIKSEAGRGIEMWSYDGGKEEHYPELSIYYSITSNILEKEETNLPEKLTIVNPNPFQNEIKVSGTGLDDSILNLSFINTLGVKVFETDVMNSERINVDFLANGIYFIHIKKDNRILLTKKMIKSDQG